MLDYRENLIVQLRKESKDNYEDINDENKLLRQRV